MFDLTNFSIPNLEWTFNSYDWYVLLVFAIFILLHVFLLKRKVFTLLFSIYISYLIVLFFPYNQWAHNLSLNELTWFKAGGFLFLTSVLFSIFRSSYLFSNHRLGVVFDFLTWLGCGILNAGLIMSLLFTLLPISFLNKFSGTSLNILSTDVARFIWLSAPMALSILFIRKKKGPGRPSLY